MGSAEQAATHRSLPLVAMVTVAVGALALAGCARGPKVEEADGSQTGSEAAPAAVGQQSEAGGDGLRMNLFRESVVCDGTDNEVGDITGAQPGELLLFSSPAPIGFNSATADESGTHRLLWNCDPSEARLQWELTATGHDSGQAVTFTVVGGLTDQVDDGGLTIDVVNEGFTCDGFTRKIGTLTGADPNEQINFTSPETANLKPGTANQFGELDLHWECEPGDAGRTWNVTALGVGSGRTGLFAIAGIAVDPGGVEELVVNVFEEPFVCDGVSREFATIENLAPSEVVDFSSSESAQLIDGRADGTGSITTRWQCGLDDVGKTWQLTALGVTSQRSTTLIITSAAPAIGDSVELAVAFTENPFGCDGTSRPFALITNFLPEEFVDFSSPQAEALRQGQADGIGELPVRWLCGAGDIDRIWDLTATGATSGRTITFRVTGAAPAG